MEIIFGIIKLHVRKAFSGYHSVLNTSKKKVSVQCQCVLDSSLKLFFLPLNELRYNSGYELLLSIIIWLKFNNVVQFPLSLVCSYHFHMAQGYWFSIHENYIKFPYKTNLNKNVN